MSGNFLKNFVKQPKQTTFTRFNSIFTKSAKQTCNITNMGTKSYSFQKFLRTTLTDCY